MGVTEDLKIGVRRCENESVNLVWRVKIDAPVEMSLAKVIKEAGDCGTGAQCWCVIA